MPQLEGTGHVRWFLFGVFVVDADRTVMPLTSPTVCSSVYSVGSQSPVECTRL